MVCNVKIILAARQNYGIMIVNKGGNKMEVLKAIGVLTVFFIVLYGGLIFPLLRKAADITDGEKHDRQR